MTADTEALALLTRVIEWEIQAQVGVNRTLAEMPHLIADTLLDFFEVRAKAGVEFPVGSGSNDIRL